MRPAARDGTGDPAAPPKDLASRDLLTFRVEAGTNLYRVTNPEHARSPAPFQPLPGSGHTDHRFNSPSGIYRVAYFGLTDRAAFVEAFLRDPAAVLAMDRRPQQVLVRFEVPEPLTLIQLHGPGLVRAGATTGSVTGGYGASQAWGEAVHALGPTMDGFTYPSARDSDCVCIALFHREGRDFPPVEVMGIDLLAEPYRTWSAEYGIAIF